MFSKSLRSSLSTRTTANGLSPLNKQWRFQSTTTATATPETTTEEVPTKQHTYRPRRNMLAANLRETVNKDFTEFSPLFEEVHRSFQKASAKDIENSFSNMISLGHLLLNKIDAIQETSGSQVTKSILYKEIINSLIDNKLIHASHFQKYLDVLINEKKYTQALTLWIENASYFKNTEAAFKDKKLSVNEARSNLKIYGLLLYLLSLIENKEKKIDPEFIKLIFGESTPATTGALERLARKFDQEEIRTAVSLYQAYKSENFDINSAESLKGIRIASTSGKLVYLEKTVSNNLAAYKGKEKLIKPSTLSHYMTYLNKSKLYSRAIELWKFALQHKIDIGTDGWNQALLAFSKIETSSTSKQVESFWEVLKKTVTPNSESYGIYIEYLFKTKRPEAAKDLISKLKKESPKLFDTTLKSALVEYLLISKHIDEAYNLFRLYEKDAEFKPTTIIYNKLLGSLVSGKKYEEATALMEDFVSNKHKNIRPDIATWVTIIDLTLKTSRELQLSEDEIMGKIFGLVKTMELNNIRLNNVALIGVATNLLKSDNTYNLGVSMLSKLEEAGIKLTSVSYSAIITSFTNRGDVEKALRYYRKAEKNGVLTNSIFYNSIFKGYSKTSEINKAKEFYQEIKSKWAKSNDNRLIPNKYTFYFMLMQGIYNQDTAFIQFVLNELGEFTEQYEDFSLGSELPKILASLQSKGYEIPESLKLHLK